MWTVYYLFSTKGPGRNSLPANLNGIWPALSTGYLAYLQQGSLVIEFSWWNVMRPFAQYNPDSVELRFKNDIWAMRAKPGIYIGGRTYIVAGVNVIEARQIKQLSNLKDSAVLETNRQHLAD